MEPKRSRGFTSPRADLGLCDLLIPYCMRAFMIVIRPLDVLWRLLYCQVTILSLIQAMALVFLYRTLIFLVGWGISISWQNHTIPQPHTNLTVTSPINVQKDPRATRSLMRWRETYYNFIIRKIHNLTLPPSIIPNDQRIRLHDNGWQRVRIGEPL